MVEEFQMSHYMIKCGNCNSEYNPKKDSQTSSVDNSCPVCGHGKKNIQELQQKIAKQNILKG
jgi:rubredoxin